MLKYLGSTRHSLEVIVIPHYGYMVRVLHCSTSQVISQALQTMELTSAQGHIMGYIGHCKHPPCPREMEEAFGLSHPTISGLLSRLEKKEFLEFRTDEQDRRCKRVYLLPKGEQCLTLLDETIQASEERLVSGFTPEERAQFTDFLKRATENMGGCVFSRDK